MREIGFSEIKSVALDILKDVAHFCDTHDIRYVLAYGTMLGAVRHKGFIPWDDDIDIMMPRDDYNRFIKLYNDQPQIKQKSNDVFVSLINKELQLTFESMFLARKFVTKAIESVTGKTVSARGAGKIKSAIGLVDDTLGIDTIGTISGVMENGVVKSILGGTKSRQNAESVSNNSGIIETVADVVEIATGKDVPKLNPNNKCEMSYDEKIDAVKKLKGLLDMGAITQEEFDAKKKDLLGL